MSETKRPVKDVLMVWLVVMLVVSVVLNIFAYYQIWNLTQEKEFPWIVVKGYVTSYFDNKPVEGAHILAFVGGKGEIPYIFSISDAYSDENGFYYLETPTFKDEVVLTCSYEGQLWGIALQNLIHLKEENATVDWGTKLFFNQNFSLIWQTKE